MTTLHSLKLFTTRRLSSFALASILAPQYLCSAQTSVEVQNAILKSIEATTVAAEAVGKVEVFAVQQGESVEVGQLLGKIRDSAVQLQVSKARIAMATARKRKQSDVELRLAKKRAEVAANELERAESANKQVADTYPPKEIDRLRLVAVSADLEIERAVNEQELLEFEVLSAENAYLQATELLSRHSIHSPVSGVVITVNRRIGEWVEPGTEFLQIINIDRLRIEGFVTSSAIENELKGCTADVTVLKGDKEVSIKGNVVFVSPDANPVNGQVRVFLEIDNHNKKFLPGMRVRAVIHQATP